MNEIRLNTEQATWLYKIRDNTNFYNSLQQSDKNLIYNILSNREYQITSKEEIEVIRQIWIRYVKLNNHKDI
jgi:hypothetical protein